MEAIGVCKVGRSSGHRGLPWQQRHVRSITDFSNRHGDQNEPGLTRSSSPRLTWTDWNRAKGSEPSDEGARGKLPCEKSPWWEGEDSNLCRLRRRFYRPLP